MRGEGLDDAVARGEGLALGHGLEQPPAHDLEALVGARRPPRALDPAEGVLEAVERDTAALAADLDLRRW